MVSNEAAWATLPERAEVARALAYAKAHEGAHLQMQIAIAQIPAPGWQESERAVFMRNEFYRVGLEDVEIDGVGNVLGWRRGTGPGVLVVAAHLDTVFPAGTDVTVRQEGTRLIGPGLADDSRGLVCLLALAEALAEGAIATTRHLLCVADVGEEGLGNLRGIRHLFTESPFRDRLEAFISIDGVDDFTITNGAVGSRRHRVTIKGPGGHSYLDFGLVNPAHALGCAMGRFAGTVVPTQPKTTFSVGRLGGGTSINAIPAEAWLEIDLRSEGPAELRDLETTFFGAVQHGVDEENRFRAGGAGQLTVEKALLGDRPAGLTPPDATIVRAAMWATGAVGATPVLEAGSTDAGVPTSLGIPAITIGGGGRAGDLHSPNEWFDPRDAYKGVQGALLTILAWDLAAGARSEA